MTQTQRLDYMIEHLHKERWRHGGRQMPQTQDDKKQLLRALMNIRPAMPIDADFLRIQDEYLQNENKARGIVCIENLSPVTDGLYLWRGDITRLQVDAIVNAANSAMLGCFAPGHGCIDNAIHTYAGMALRLECDAMMKKQGFEEPAGGAKITGAYNLPCRHIIHTVGPIVAGKLTQRDCEQLASCYRSCLQLALKQKLTSIAFCCISTGEFHFPPDDAAQIAVDTVKKLLRDPSTKMKVIFNVFTENDETIYRRLLAGGQSTERGT